ncbi:hypothetical protein JTB14_014765 [Gonioctena quinquepunctata]|nr:hypothetical protein JTB14_014765 [Gonioctena quinquepunctata]
MDQVTTKPNSPYLNIRSGIKRNMMSGFCATGVHPFNKNKVLDRLPREHKISEQEVESTLTTFLKESRYGNSSNQPARKKKRLDVAPGKSIATRDGNVTTSSHQPGTSCPDRSNDTASISHNSHDHHPTEINQLDPIEEDTSQAESSNQNNQEEQEDESNVDDNFAEEEVEEIECTEGKYVYIYVPNYTNRSFAS